MIYENTVSNEYKYVRTILILEIIDILFFITQYLKLIGFKPFNEY